MAITSKTLRIASRLYEARDAARIILKDKYLDRMASLQELIREFMVEKNCEALPATMAIVTQLQKESPISSGTEQMMILSAYVEMVEPTPEEDAA